MVQDKTHGGLLGIRWWTSWFYKKWGISLSPPQEGLILVVH